jgi:hypothetical protein
VKVSTQLRNGGHCCLLPASVFGAYHIEQDSVEEIKPQLSFRSSMLMTEELGQEDMRNYLNFHELEAPNVRHTREKGTEQDAGVIERKSKAKEKSQLLSTL